MVARPSSDAASPDPLPESPPEPSPAAPLEPERDAASTATGGTDGASTAAGGTAGASTATGGTDGASFDAGTIHELLERTVSELVSLLHADGAMVYLVHADGWLRLAHDAGITDAEARRWAVGLRLRVGEGLFGRAVAEQLEQRTGDYERDSRFRHAPAADRVVVEVGIRSMIVAPLVAGDRAIGAVGAFSDRRDAFSDADVALLRALAGHASIAIANAQLIAELAASQAELARTAAAERSLREIAAQLAAIRDPAELLQRAVDAAAALSDVDWAEIATIQPDGRIQWRHEAGISDPEMLAALRRLPLRVGQGVLGRAVAERRVVVTGDYLADTAFDHAEASDAFAESAGFRSLAAAPLVTDRGVVGVLGVHSSHKDAFGPGHVALIAAFADIAAVAMSNADLINEIDRSRAELRRRVDAERALREIAARITQLRDPAEVLQQVLTEAQRLLGSDDAHLVLLAEGGGEGAAVVAVGEADDAAMWDDVSHSLGSGLNRIAVTTGAPVWTRDYMIDESLPLEMREQFAMNEHPPHGAAAAPLRAPEGVIVGSLTVLWNVPHDFTQDEIDLLAGLADQAAIVVGNVRLYGRLRESEARYRDLLETSPDIVFSVDAEGRFTYVSETIERLLGWNPDEVVGRPFSAVIHPGSLHVANDRWRQLQDMSGDVLAARFDLAHRDGRAIPFEVRSSGVTRGGVFSGVQGSARDISEQDRLERELRESEERYRHLAKASPDVVWAVDAEGYFTFLGDRLEQLTGFRPSRFLGRHFAELTDPESIRPAMAVWEAVQREPSGVYPLAILMPQREGGRVPVEIWVTGMVREGRFSGAHGSIRDMRDHERLERGLRSQAAELAASRERAHLARELHDSVTQALFSMTLVTRSVELLLDRDPEAAKAKLETLRELQADALAEMRALIFELRPASLETEGLVRALRTHAAAVEGRSGIAIVIDDDLEDRLPAECESALFRIAQESLHNVVKHAGAGQVQVMLRRDGDRVELRVEDDGAGFDPAAVTGDHLGLAGMRARAEKLGGTFDVASERGRGTRIEVVIPLDSVAVDEPVTPQERAGAGEDPLRA